jgi:hypothetical protein
MWFGLLTLATALIISVSAAYYSILGLTAIFAAAFWPIVILGSSLEVGKIVSTLWLHKYWDRAEAQYKVYLCSAVAILMVLTSMGVFGFLSKAHTDQSLVSGDVVAKISIYDEKIKQSRDNIDMARRALTQMDAAVDQTMSRSSTEQGADKAAQLRRSQTAERNRLLKEIDTEQKKIQKISEERAPIAAEVRKVEAEVGPIKYIAALIYGDNPDTNLLEKSVRWVIILIVIVFDPLALTLLLAATKSIEWERGINVLQKPVRRPEYEPDNGPLTDEQLDQLRARAQADLPTGPVITKDTLFPEADEFFDRARTVAQNIDAGTYEPPIAPDTDQPVVAKQSKFRVLTGLDNMWNRSKTTPITDSESEHALIESLPVEPPIKSEETDDVGKINDHDTDEYRLEILCERSWKNENPDKTLKRERQLYRAGIIKELPWNNAEFRARISEQISQLRGFGTDFPITAIKGDMFLRVDRLPSVLYKFNGANWIEVDKSQSDQYAYDDAYINYLIEKISTGEYDTDLLSDAERDCIERKLRNE